MTPGILHITHQGREHQIQFLAHDRGSADYPVLVFLHEGLGCAESWKRVPRDLAERTGCRAFSYSRLGYGGSSGICLPRQSTYLHTEALGLLPRILDAAGIDCYILVGHSDGGSIALIHAGGLQPEGLKGVITLAAHLFCEAVTIQGLKEAREWYEQGDLKPRLERIHGTNTETAFRGWNDTWLDPEFRDWNIEPYMGSIQVPVLGLQGADDPYGTQAQLDAMAAGSPLCRIRAIENCGHIPHLQQPGATLDLMAGFVLSLL